MNVTNEDRILRNGCILNPNCDEFEFNEGDTLIRTTDGNKKEYYPTTSLFIYWISTQPGSLQQKTKAFMKGIVEFPVKRNGKEQE